jgi:WhiB family redox-sensing transcriptional regulator
MNQIASLMEMVIIREDWTADALCAQVGGDDHFAARHKVDEVNRARDVCARCNVVAECLAYALRANETVGVWGGKSAKELRDIRRARRQS